VQSSKAIYLHHLWKRFHRLRKQGEKILLKRLLWKVKGGDQMMKEERLIHYQIAISVFSRWYETGLISKEESMEAEEAVATKYGLAKSSIYREKTCY